MAEPLSSFKTSNLLLVNKELQIVNFQLAI